MATIPRLFVSVPDDRALDGRRQSLKQAIIKRIAACGFRPVGFEPEQFGTGQPVNMDEWTVDRANQLIRNCDGMLVLALARTHAHVFDQSVQKGSPFEANPRPFPSPYNHLEGALAISQGLPVFIISEEGMDSKGIFASGIKSTPIPSGADASWVDSIQFANHFDAWVELVRKRRDVFLGYCSQADSVALALREHLEAGGYSVLDWARDFDKAGTTILEQIEKASGRCRCAIFIFTKDDELTRRSTAKASFEALPRDNVLLEAGYFTRSHGKGRVAIIREKGAKMPADIGGIVYLSFDDRNDLGAVKAGIEHFLANTLNSI